MKSKIILLVSVCIIIFNSCRDISFNNPLDPNASKDSAKLIKIIETSVYSEGDIDYEDGTIWKISNSGTLYMLDVESGMTIRTMNGRSGRGIAYNEGKLYICNGNNDIAIYDPLSGELLKQILTTAIYPKYICFNENEIIVYDERSKAVYTIDNDTGKANRLFELSGIEISGLCNYKGGFLISDKQTDLIYFFSSGGKIENVYNSPTNSITGIASDMNDIIYIANTNGQIYKVSLP